MIREELLILWRTLIELLNKNFIRVSDFSTVFSVLFIRKSNKDLRFCVSYHSLNIIIKKNRYSLSLIQKMLSMISKAKWFTKLNVSAAFHKIRIIKDNK